MTKFTVDGPNKLFIAKPGVTEVDVIIDLYSDGKEHWLTEDDAKFLFPLRAAGGDDLGGGAAAPRYVFMLGGWRIRPDNVDHTLTFRGNLFPDPITNTLIAATPDPHQVIVVHQRTDQAQVDAEQLLAGVVDDSDPGNKFDLRRTLRYVLAAVRNEASTAPAGSDIDVAFDDVAGDPLFSYRKSGSTRTVLTG